MAALVPVRETAIALPSDADCPVATDRAGGLIRAGLAVSVLFFGVFGAWSALAPLDSSVNAQGVVKVEDNRKTVQHREGGVVSALTVREGDRVEQGQLLLRLDDGELNAIVEVLNNQVREFRAMEARLQAERDGADTVTFPAELVQARAQDAGLDKLMRNQLALFKSRREELDGQISVLNQRIAQLNDQISGLQAQSAATAHQQRLIAEELNGLRELLKSGATPANHVRETERMAAGLGGQLGSQGAEMAKLREAISEMKMQMLQLRQQRTTEIATQLRDTQQKLFEALPQLQARRAALARTEVRSPATGFVVGLSAFTVGGVIAPGEHIMDIVPVEQPLVIEAQLKPEDINYIAPGRRTEIHFTGIKQRYQTSAIHGTLRRISADRLTDPRTGLSYFLAEVEVDMADVRANNIALVAGMPADVVIAVGERTPFEYLMQPLNFGLRRAMHEP